MADLFGADLPSFIDRRGKMGEIALDDELAKWIRANPKTGRQ